jgi:serine/threonine-protein kinase
MFRVLTLTLVAVSIALGATIISTTATLPPRVATHFAVGGAPNGWMTRDGYLVFMLAFALAVPWFVFAMTVLLPSRFPRMSNLPNRDYWLAPERIDATLDTLRTFGAGVALLVAVFLGAMHWAILDANAAQPARLAEGPFIAGIVAFVVVLLAAVLMLYLRFSSRPVGRR